MDDLTADLTTEELAEALEGRFGGETLNTRSFTGLEVLSFDGDTVETRTVSLNQVTGRQTWTFAEFADELTEAEFVCG